MADGTLDPNRYATGAEATDISIRLNEQQAILEVFQASSIRARADLEELRAQLRDVESQYMLAKERFNAAEAYSQTAQGRYDAQLDIITTERRFLHPIRMTPLEILGRIFEYCLPDIDGSHFLLHQEPEFMESQSFVLAAVCRRWRHASLTSPRAWSYLQVSFDVIKKRTADSWNQMVKCILSRSAHVLVDLSVRREKFPRSVDQQLGVTAELVSRAMRRCRALRLTVDTIHNDDYMTSIVCSDAPNVVTACLTTTKSKPGLPSSFNDSILRGATILRDINCSPEFLASLSILPSVTRLACHRAVIADDRNDVANAFAKAPNVTSLALTHPRIRYGAPLSKIQGLETLSITFQSRCAVEALADMVQFPNLSGLWVAGDSKNSSKRIQFIHAINPERLTTLQFFKLAADDVPAFVKMFGSFRLLRALSLRDTSFTRAGFRSLCVGLTEKDADDNWRNPSLYQIQFYSCSFHDCDTGDLTACIRTLVAASRLPVDDARHRPKLQNLKVVGSWDRPNMASLNVELNQILRS